jgi:putative membrane protein
MFLIPALALGLASLMACDRKDEGGYGSSGAKDNTGRAATSDSSWLVKAAEANLAEIETGRLAEAKGSSTDVKQFGKHMVEDHTKANSELTVLARKKGITVPTRPDEKHLKAAGDLADLGGAEFDRKYADMAVSDHEDAVSLFEKNANSTDPDVKAFAGKTLPTLKHHLEMARDLKNKVNASPKAD